MDRIISKVLHRPELTLKSLRCVMKVVEVGSVSRAAKQIAKSQTAVTKAIHKVEKSIGKSLFDRSTSGMWPTAEGELLAGRVSNAFNELQRAGRFYSQHAGFPTDIDRLPLFNLGANKQTLARFIYVFDYRDALRAAELVDVKPPTIQRAVRELESQLRMPLFERTATGQLTPTLIGTEIARAAKLAFVEIGTGIDEINSLDQSIIGHVRIGTLPFVRNEVIPNAIVKVVNAHEGISVSTNEADYEAQEVALRSGELDLIVGPTSLSDKDVDLVAEPFLRMGFRFVVRKGHPLARAGCRVSKADLAQLGWVLPPRPTAHRATFDRFMNAHDIPIEGKVVETSLYNAARGIVQQSDLALISRQMNSELGSFVALTPDFATEQDIESLTITSHIVTRRRTTVSPAVRLFIAMLRESVEEADTDSGERF